METKTGGGVLRPCGCGAQLEPKMKAQNTVITKGFKLEKPIYKGNPVMNAQK